MVSIKKYDPKYADDVRTVCINTAPPEAKTDKNMHDFIIYTFCDYYIEQEPENVFVLVDEETDTAQGYVFGASDFRSYIKKMKPYLEKVKKTGKVNYRDAIMEILGHAIFSLKYPAHLHIDINAPYRGNGNGSKMISTLTESMKAKGTKSIMLIVGTGNKRGINFYKKNGFKVLCSLKSSGTVMAKEL